MRLVCPLLAMLVLSGCSFDDRGQGRDDGNGGRLYRDAGPPAGPCTNLQCRQTTCTMGSCQVPACPSGTSTTVTGTIYEPAGRVPLYNVHVYVPNRDLAPMPEGASCDHCDTALSGIPIAKTVTDASGRFTLRDVPVGTDVPLVIQIGRWRRETTIPNVAACTNTALTNTDVTRLPRNKDEGHIPKIALTTGGADALECLLLKIGIDRSEFTPESGTGRVNLFAGGTQNGNPSTNDSPGTNAYRSDLNGGMRFTEASAWWNSAANLRRYDIILHSCEGLEPQDTNNKSAAALQALFEYANAGGRVFASHWHNYWIERGPAPWPTVAAFDHRTDPMGAFIGTIDTSFTKGREFSSWMQTVGASTTPGQFPIAGAQLTVRSVNTPMSQRWVYNMGAQSVQYFSFLTPVNDMNACGKVVFSDLHVSAGSGGNMDDASAPSLPFPDGCRTTSLSPQEKALLFMLFDLGACIDFKID
jgi:hypothetical protein